MEASGSPIGGAGGPFEAEWRTLQCQDVSGELGLVKVTQVERPDPAQFLGTNPITLAGPFLEEVKAVANGAPLTITIGGSAPIEATELRASVEQLFPGADITWALRSGLPLRFNLSAAVGPQDELRVYLAWSDGHLRLEATVRDPAWKERLAGKARLVLHEDLTIHLKERPTVAPAVLEARLKDVLGARKLRFTKAGQVDQKHNATKELVAALVAELQDLHGLRVVLSLSEDDNGQEKASALAAALADAGVARHALITPRGSPADASHIQMRVRLGD